MKKYSVLNYETGDTDVQESKVLAPYILNLANMWK
jgi:hypothetical protein